ncbi:unnamed protein product [Cyprideis torosa]|uniref:Uncharacterized protein n=1 Tax=Cyprideis torosa TaxID=163714 RepID=A0A7R8W5I2_9CRUS|nr:unnamed protein product [Cyprideis torosa]CAG0885234.1 unnamed protein product [Cyprideis torosa]
MFRSASTPAIKKVASSPAMDTVVDIVLADGKAPNLVSTSAFPNRRRASIIAGIFFAVFLILVFVVLVLVEKYELDKQLDELRMRREQGEDILDKHIYLFPTQKKSKENGDFF